MQPSVVRRYTRPAQPGRGGVGYLSHTSPSATFAGAIQLSTDYVSSLKDSIRLSDAEQNIWQNEVWSVAQRATESKNEARQEALAESNTRVEHQRQQQQRLLEAINSERQQLAQQRIERQRQEEESMQQAATEAQRRRVEAIAAAEERHRRAIEEADQRRRDRLRDCVICMEDRDVDLMAQTPCGHWSCRTCLREGFEASAASRTRYQCCQQAVPISLIADQVSNDFTQEYEMMVLEQTTANPTYCANAACATFIPPTNYIGPDSATCIRCGRDTCRHCRTAGHVGRGCTADQATELVRALASIAGWKSCPTCATMVERRDGCRHMTCRCGAQFCYSCGGNWSRCRSHCLGRWFGL